MSFRKGFLLPILLFGFCLPPRTDIQMQDIQKVIDRLAYVRFANRIEVEDITKLKTDKQLFQEICEIYRLDENSVLEKLKETHPRIYKKLGTTNEK
jgi:hypothetical protein